MMIKDFAGKVAFVTGGASGIGLGIARAMAEEGAKLAIADVRSDVLEAAADDLRRSGATVATIALDVRDRPAWEAAVERVERELGPVQLLVNNAGVSMLGLTFDEVSPGMWDQIVDINLTGVYNGIHYFLPGMLAAGSGHIVNTSSMGGLVGFAALSAYSATKFAVVGLSESLRAEFEPHNIGVSVLCPGGVRSDLWRTSRGVRGLPDTDVPPSDMSAQSASATGMDPYEVGGDVVRAILANELYVITHPELSSVVATRGANLLAAFEGSAARKAG